MNEVTTTLGRALAEMEKRNETLASLGLHEATDSMPPIRAVIHWPELDASDVRTAAERLARAGRKARVSVLILVPDPGRVTLAELGGSDLLRWHANDGRTVRLESER